MAVVETTRSVKQQWGIYKIQAITPVIARQQYMPQLSKLKDSCDSQHYQLYSGNLYFLFLYTCTYYLERNGKKGLYLSINFTIILVGTC